MLAWMLPAAAQSPDSFQFADAVQVIGRDGTSLLIASRRGCYVLDKRQSDLVKLPIHLPDLTMQRAISPLDSVLSRYGAESGLLLTVSILDPSDPAQRRTVGRSEVIPVTIVDHRFLALGTLGNLETLMFPHCPVPQYDANEWRLELLSLTREERQDFAALMTEWVLYRLERASDDVVDREELVGTVLSCGAARRHCDVAGEVLAEAAARLMASGPSGQPRPAESPERTLP